MTATRILVCGNRDWTCERTIRHWLSRAEIAIQATYPPTLIHGNCGHYDQHGRATQGADVIAGDIARILGWDVKAYPADWNKHGKSAGPIRNREMADTLPDVGLAFGKLYRGSKLTGTGDMVSVLNARGVPVIVISEPLKRSCKCQCDICRRGCSDECGHEYPY